MSVNRTRSNATPEIRYRCSCQPLLPRIEIYSLYGQAVVCSPPGTWVAQLFHLFPDMKLRRSPDAPNLDALQTVAVKDNEIGIELAT